jgi:two-component system, sensor histidine kinase
LPVGPNFIPTTDHRLRAGPFVFMELTMGESISSSSMDKNILCVEEHGEISILLSRMLKKSKCKVLHAKNKVQAEDHLRTEQPVLVLIENNFYENGGIIYAAELKIMFPAIKLMMLSAAQDGQIKEEAAHAGVDIFLIKPFTKSQLLDSVAALLNLPL